MFVKARNKVYALTVYAALVVEQHELDLRWIAQAIELEAKSEDDDTGISIHEKWIRLPEEVLIIQVSVDHDTSSVLGIFIEYTD